MKIILSYSNLKNKKTNNEIIWTGTQLYPYLTKLENWANIVGPTKNLGYVSVTISLSGFVKNKYFGFSLYCEMSFETVFK